MSHLFDASDQGSMQQITSETTDLSKAFGSNRHTLGDTGQQQQQQKGYLEGNPAQGSSVNNEVISLRRVLRRERFIEGSD